MIHHGDTETQRKQEFDSNLRVSVSPWSNLFPELFPPRSAGRFHTAVGGGAAHADESRHAQRELLHPVAREFAALGFGEDLAHLGFVDDARAARADGELTR